MYSNTIYILNNTILECFDIAFNETKKEIHHLSNFMLQKRKEQPPLQNGSMVGNHLVTHKRAILLYTSDNRIIASRG